MHRQVEQQLQKLMQSPLRNSFRLDSSSASVSIFDEAASPLASVSRSGGDVEIRGLLRHHDHVVFSRFLGSLGSPVSVARQHQHEAALSTQPQREVDQDEDTVGLSAANTIRVLRAKLKAQEQDIETLSQKLSSKERDFSKTDDSFKDLREDLAKETRLRAHAQAAAEKFKKILDEKVTSLTS